MRILVTGGSGNVGGYVLDELAGLHDITILDLRKSAKHSDLPLLKVDLMDAGEAMDAVKGFDVVIHLAAIPNPSRDPGDRVLHVNTVSAYNLMEAVRENGIPRVVYAGSESATGFGIHNVLHTPLYLPIDEEHPSWPHETYSLSKYFGEIICREYAHAYGMKVICLRYAWVWFREDKEAMKGFVRSVQDSGDPTFGAYVFAEDVAQACRLSLEHAFAEDGYFERFYITARDTYHGVDSISQVMKLYPGRKPPINAEYFAENPHASFFSTEKANRMLGYAPRFGWKDLFEVE